MHNPGDFIDKYRITSLLGQGGMGSVYEAENTVIGKRVAVKLLRHEFAEHESTVQRFLQEARTASAVDHPGIVEIYDFGWTTNKEPYLVMELLRGLNLAELIAMNPAGLPIGYSLELASQMVSVLSAVHENNIIHRDLKPENIFLSRRAGAAERVRILDFGISKMKTDDATMRLTQTGTVLGTPFYMSPEQATGAKDVDHRVDIWAAGAILFEMLTGKVPFYGESYNEVLVKIFGRTFTEPRLLRPDIPEQAEAIVLRAMTWEKEQRYASAAPFLQDLSAICQQIPSEGPPAIPDAPPTAETADPNMPSAGDLVATPQPARGIAVTPPTMLADSAQLSQSGPGAPVADPAQSAPFMATVAVGTGETPAPTAEASGQFAGAVTPGPGQQAGVSGPYPGVTPVPGQSQPGALPPGQSQPGMGYPGQSQPGQSYPGQSQPGMAYPGQSQPGVAVAPGQSYPGAPGDSGAMLPDSLSPVVAQKSGGGKSKVLLIVGILGVVGLLSIGVGAVVMLGVLGEEEVVVPPPAIASTTQPVVPTYPTTATQPVVPSLPAVQQPTKVDAAVPATASQPLRDALTPREITKALEPIESKVRNCLKSASPPPAKVALRMQIAGDGTATFQDTEPSQAPPVKTCLEGLLAEVRFPPTGREPIEHTEAFRGPRRGGGSTGSGGRTKATKTPAEKNTGRFKANPFSR